MTKTTIRQQTIGTPQGDAPTVSRVEEFAGEQPVDQASGLVVNVLRLPEVRRMTGLSRSTIYELQAERRFPQAVKITERCVGWIEAEVQAWLAKRIERSRRRTTNA